MSALGARCQEPQLFIAVTTGQNISNLPPIIELGMPGRDGVLWLDSELARQRQWSKGATSVLVRRGFRVLEPQLLPEEPSEIWQCLVALHELCAREGLRPIWVANGGPKPVSLALNVKLEGRPLLPIVYSEPRPVEYWFMPDGIVGPRHKNRYANAGLSLGEVLATSGHFIWNAGDAVRFWPGDVALGDDAYGVDSVTTGQVHDASADRRLRADLIAAGHTGEPVYLSDGLATHPDLVEGWLKAAWAASRNLCRKAPIEPPDWNAFGRENREVLAGLFNGAQNTANRLRRVLAGVPPVARSDALGTRFEMAVARRVKAWLEANTAAIPVNEAWHSVKVRHEEQPSLERAELDIVLVLANGVLLSLECKTFKELVVLKDLHARLLNLMRSTSQLAQMCVCAPLYTDHADKPWFAAQHELRRKVADFGFTCLPFTLPGQAASYTAEAADGTREAVECHPFEGHLDRLLKPYLPGG